MEMIKIDPEWRRYGKVWDDKDRSYITEIYIYHGNHVFSLQFVYVENRTLVLSEKHGAASSPGSNFDVVKFDYPSEFLTGINVVYRDERGSLNYNCKSISAISFCTNRGKYGPFGSVDKRVVDYTYINYQLGPGRAFGGFHGTATSLYLETLGLYFRLPTQLSNNVNDNVSEVKKENGED